MKKTFLIGIFIFFILCTVSASRVVVVSSEAQAITELAKPVVITQPTCEILNVSKTVVTLAAMSSQEYSITYMITYYLDNKLDHVFGKTKTTTVSVKKVQDAVQMACETTFNKADKSKIVIIDLGKQTTQVFDLLTKKWKDKIKQSLLPGK